MALPIYLNSVSVLGRGAQDVVLGSRDGSGASWVCIPHAHALPCWTDWTARRTGSPAALLPSWPGCQLLSSPLSLVTPPGALPSKFMGVWLNGLSYFQSERSLLAWSSGTSPHAPSSVRVQVSMTTANVSWEPGYDGGFEQTFSVWYGPL